MKSNSPAIVEITRGSFVESSHAIDIVVSDAEGALPYIWGEEDRMIFPRSSIKSLQALPLVESGAADAFGFDDADLALACSSHNAEAMHVERAANMLQKAGNGPVCLECGAQMPRMRKDRLALENGPKPIHNPCSGKHAGFLAFARQAGFSPEGYTKIDHPVQKEIASVLETVTGHPHKPDNHGIDGCSIPSYWMPLDKLATAYAKFAVGHDVSKSRAAAMNRIRSSCIEHPEMIAGTKRSCTRLMQALGNRAFAKFGAEGVYTIALPELGLGIAMKARDGGVRAIEVAAANTISYLLELTPEEKSKMNSLIQPLVVDRRGEQVGTMRLQL
ncbi:MAG: asparaginase [Pseudomonadota bacterium]